MPANSYLLFLQKTVLYLALAALVCASGDAEHNKTEAQSRIDTYLTPPQENALQKQSHPQGKEQKSFMSKLASWFFPFGGSDDTAQDVTPAEGQSRAQYALPPQRQEDKHCSPCNSVPWVPIASSRGPHALLEFKPQSQPILPSSHGASFNLQSQQQHGPPPQEPSGHYGPPQEPSGHYGPPQEPSGLYGLPQEPSGLYGAPQVPSGHYGPPQGPSGHYGPPSTIHIPSQEPSGHYSLPQEPSGQYGPPVIPLTNYGPPPPVVPLTHQQNYAPPQPQIQHGQSLLPSEEYGPPPPPVPAGQYGTPHSHDQFIAASQHSPSKEQQYHKQKSPNFKQGSPVKPNSHLSTKPYKFIPVKFMQFPKLDLGPKPPNQGPPVMFKPLQPQQHRVEVQKIPPLEVPADNFAAPINSRPATFVVPPAVQFTAAPHQFPHVNHFGSSVRGPIIPLPNLSVKPVLPIRNYQKFKTGFSRPLPQQNAYIPVHANSNHHEVEVQPSIPIAGYLASIEHPINVVQSPIVEVTVREQGTEESGDNVGQTVGSTTARAHEETYSTKTDFKENPIVVPDSDDAETSNNQTTHEVFDVNNKRGNDNSLGVFSFNGKVNSHDQILKENEELIEQILSIQETTTYSPTSTQRENYSEFTTPPVDYTAWTPSFITTNQSPSDKMTPPFESPSPWTNYITGTPTTKKPKQIQVIVPYITNQKPMPFNSQKSEALPMYFTPPSKAPVWPKYLEQKSQKVVTAHKPSLIQATNIKELLKGEIDSKQRTVPPLPFDILTLQKTIDDWTQQEFSNKLSIRDEPKITTSNKLAPSKNIPNNFFTTKAYSSTTSEQYNDHSVASSVQRETKVRKDVADFESNFISLDGSSEKPTTISGEEEGVSGESVYIVTAKPWSKGNEEPLNGNVTHKTATFAIRLESENDTINANKTEKVIYSEWPHLSK